MVWNVVYNIYFHPLSRFPGPPLWTLSRLPFVFSMQRGTLVHRINSYHSRYGLIVRVAPNELSFIDPAACRDIYGARPGQPRFPKNQVWTGDPISRGSSLVDANDEDHARMRKVWSHNFTDRALKEQESLLQSYANSFVEQLRAHGDGASVDIVQWFNFLTFDLTGDLAFGESFRCLDGKVLHPWIEMIFSHIKSATLLASIRFYPSMYRLLLWSLPSSVLRKQQEHFQTARDKVQTRMNLGNQRLDFLQNIIKYQHNNDSDRLTEAEVEKTAATMIVAGSETTGTLLAGIMNHLMKHPECMKILVSEIRTSFINDAEMGITSLAKLPYLGAVIQEGLRIAPPVPAGMPRVVPAGGAQVCGHWLATSVSNLPQPIPHLQNFGHNTSNRSKFCSVGLRPVTKAKTPWTPLT